MSENAAPEPTPDTSTAAELADLAALTDAMENMAAFLRDSPDIAATLRHDLHAILEGRDTLQPYDFPTWLAIRTALTGVTSEQLAEAIGPAGTPLRVIIRPPR